MISVGYRRLRGFFSKIIIMIIGTGGPESWWTSGDHPNYNIIEKGQNKEKSPGQFRRLAVTQTPVKDHQRTLMWKTLMSNDNNNNTQKGLWFTNYWLQVWKGIELWLITFTVWLFTVWSQHSVGRGARGSERCESSLIDFMAHHKLVNRFLPDNPGREMWTWLDSSYSVRTRSYLDSWLILLSVPRSTTERAQTIGLLGSVLGLADRPSLAGHWKLNTSLLDVRDFRDWQESLVQRALAGAFTGDKWWRSRKHRINDFAIKYGLQLNLDRTKVAISLEDKLSRAVKAGVSFAVDLARRDHERGASDRYKG